MVESTAIIRQNNTWSSKDLVNKVLKEKFAQTESKYLKKACLLFRLLICIAGILGLARESLIFHPEARLPTLNSRKYTYYTMQSNVLVAAMYVDLLAHNYRVSRGYSNDVQLTPYRWRFWKPAFTVMISVTGIVFYLLIAPTFDTPLWPNYGWISTDFLHYWTPLLCAVDWLIFEPRGNLKPKYVVGFCVLPLGYMFFACMRATYFGPLGYRPDGTPFYYWYPFIDTGRPSPLWAAFTIQNPKGVVVLNCLGIAIGVTIYGACMLIVDKLLSMRNRFAIPECETPKKKIKPLISINDGLII